MKTQQEVYAEKFNDEDTPVFIDTLTEEFVLNEDALFDVEGRDV